jgi:hypothetical protein
VKRFLVFVSVAALQLLITVGLLAFVLARGRSRPVSGPGPVAESVARWALEVLSFPILPLLDLFPAVRISGAWWLVPFVVNASIWGFAALAIRRRRR